MLFYYFDEIATINSNARKEKIMSLKIDPWNTRFAFFWYNDKEIFHSTQDDFNLRAQDLAGQGLNHIITFSLTHFRWSFRRYWDLLTETLAKIVKACHENGILVTEHHSATLTYNPLNDEDMKRLKDGFVAMKSSLDSWPRILEDCNANPQIEGVPVLSMKQIDGRTGELARSNYHGWVFCPTNPHYRKAYLDYLETLYQTGIDGIMTDDVQLFGDWNACACPVCRKLFKEQTGYEMPPPGQEWQRWHGNYEEPSFVAWLKFRFRCLEDFHQAVKAHYAGLGLRPLRPNYSSDALHTNHTAYSLETLPDLDWISIECCFSQIIRYSWPYWSIEIPHRFAVARPRNIPSGNICYPNRADTVIFTWALSKAWGMLWQPVPNPKAGAGNDELYGLEKRLMKFEKDHFDLFRQPGKFARLGFYDSKKNRDLYEHAEARSLCAMRNWMDACFRCNVPLDLFQTPELPDQIKTYDLVVLNEVAIMSDEELEIFHSFVINGGTLVWTGPTGTKDETGADRPADFLETLWGIDGLESAQDGGPTASFDIGRGKLVMAPGNWRIGEPLKRYVVDRQLAVEQRIPAGIENIEKEREKFRQITDFLTGLLPDGPDITIENLPDDVIVTAFVLPHIEAIAVHVVNAAGTFDTPSDGLWGHADKIPFPRITGDGPIRISIRKPEAFREVCFDKAYYFDPMKEGPELLDTQDREEKILLEIPADLIQEYGLIELKTDS